MISTKKMTTTAYKTESVNRTRSVRYCPFVFTGDASRTGNRDVSAELVEAIPLNKIKYNEQCDAVYGLWRQ